MASRRRRAARSIGAREAHAIAANLGRDLRVTRRRRHVKQEELGDRVGVSQAEISALEAGAGARTSIETWVAIGIALDRPIAIAFSRDVVEPLRDAGHLAAQELLIRLSRSAGWHASFEARTELASAALSTDVLLERNGAIVLVEIWNRLDDLGAAVRSSDRKLAAGAPSARSVWLLVDTAANHAVAKRYPAILRARFGAPSALWVTALVGGNTPPDGPGIVWIDVRSGRLRPLRLRIGGRL